MTHYKVILVFDPGLKGSGIVVVNNKLVDFLTYPIVKLRNKSEIDGSKLANLLKEKLGRLSASLNETFAIVEQVHAMPKQGVTSTFNFGFRFGRLIGILDGLGIQWDVIHPRAWSGFIYKTFNKKYAHELDKKDHTIIADLLYILENLEITKEHKISLMECCAMYLAYMNKHLEEGDEQWNHHEES
jgi:hypothetical protein